MSELKAFSQTAEFAQLQPETQKQLKDVVSLLEKSQNLYFLIDDFRSSNLRTIFLAITGIGSDSIGDQDLETEQLQELIGEARRLISSLSSGEKAVFPAGTILHETLLAVEKIDNGHFELRYFNTADHVHPKRKYLIESSTLLGDAFWKDLYSAKFLKKATPLIKQFNEFDPIQNAISDSSSRLCQKRNTCHLRSLLAFVKDMIVDKSSLSIEEAHFDYHVFKELFGQFLLKNNHLSNENMDRLCREKQKKRITRREMKLKDFQDCWKQGKAQETLLVYNTLLKDFFPESDFDSTGSGNLIYDLIQKEKTFFGLVENDSNLADILASYSAKVSNPWVKKTLARALEKLVDRQKEFLKLLQKELEEISPPYYLPCKTFKRSFYKKWNEIGRTLNELASQKNIRFDPIYLVEYRKGMDRFPIEKKEVQRLLDQFEKSPEMLHFLDQKPCCRFVLKQAIRWGMIEQVDKIFQHFPKADQEEILSVCRNASFFPSAIFIITDFIVSHPNSELAKSVFAKACLDMLGHGKSSEFLRAAKAMVMADPNVFIGLENAYISFRAPLEIPQEEMTHFLILLSSLYQVNKQGSLPGVVSWLYSCLGQSLLKHEKIELKALAAQLNAPEWENYCPCIQLARLYQAGDFENVKRLEGKTISSFYRLETQFRFSRENVHIGLELLKMTFPPAFLSMVFRDLVSYACQNRSNEILVHALKIYLNHPVLDNADIWYRLDYKDLYYIGSILIDVEGNPEKIRTMISFLVRKVDSKEKFDQINPVVNALCLKYPPLLDSLPYVSSKYSDAPSQSFLAQAARKEECSRAFMNLVASSGDYRRGETFLDYRQHFKTFLKTWELLTKNENFSDLTRVFKELVQPIFEMHIGNRGSEVVILDLLKQMAFPESARLPLAVLYKEIDKDKKEGKEDRALMILPDKEKLNAAYTTLFPEDKPLPNSGE